MPHLPPWDMHATIRAQAGIAPNAITIAKQTGEIDHENLPKRSRSYGVYLLTIQHLKFIILNKFRAGGVSMQMAELVKKIFINDETKKEFQADPEKFISTMDLAATEKRAVLSLQAKTGLVTADGVSLQSNVGPMAGWL